jgi:hypothetical protein
MSGNNSSRDPTRLVGVGRIGEGDKDSTVIVEEIRRRVARPAVAQGGSRR